MPDDIPQKIYSFLKESNLLISLKKTRLDSSYYDCTEIGNRILVWSKKGQPPSKTGRTKVLITAHGIGALIKSDLKIKTDKITLHWFGPHGYVLSDPGICSVIKSGTQPTSTTVITKGSKPKVQDYWLTKYRKDSYEEVSTKVHPEYFKEELEKSKKNPKEVILLKPEEEEFLAKELDMDIITIRHRPFRTPTSLFAIITALHKAGWLYTDFYCSFCRGIKKNKSKK